MIAIVLDAGAPAACEPLTCTRNLAAIPVANLPLQEQQLERLVQCGLHLAGEADEAKATGRCFYQRGDAWLSHEAVYLLRNTLKPAVLRDAAGEPLAWTGLAPTLPENAQNLAADDACLLIRYPWDLLRVNELLVGAIEKNSYPGRLDDRVEVQGRVIIGRNTRVLPGTFIEDNVIIGRNCKIGPNCYLRGNTAIGDDCHIGQAVEIKNSILMNRVAIGHLSYCGDSIVGEGTNFGAGTITANYRHDGKSHRSMIGGHLVDTKRLKFGAIIGDDVHTGIHTSIYPGRKLWPHCWTRPGEIVQKDLCQTSMEPRSAGPVKTIGAEPHD